MTDPRNRADIERDKTESFRTQIRNLQIEVERLTELETAFEVQVTVMRAAIDKIINLEGAEGMTDTKFAIQTLNILNAL